MISDRGYLAFMQELLTSMIMKVVRLNEGYSPTTAVPNLGLAVVRHQQAPETGSFGPLISVVLQGAKELVVGDRSLRYAAGTCFCATIPIHTSGCIVTASADEPYVAISMDLDQDRLADLLASLPHPILSDEAATFGAALASRELLEALGRMVDLLDMPDDIPFLAPAREREVVYRLLQGSQGSMLWQFARKQSRVMRVKRAVDWIEAHYHQRLPTRELADLAAMSVPSLHRHFKAATAMSPLAYQKVVRLQQARRRLLDEYDVAKVAYAVGYESVSQFSREYKRFFGVSPSAENGHVARLPLQADVTG